MKLECKTVFDAPPEHKKIQDMPLSKKAVRDLVAREKDRRKRRRKSEEELAIYSLTQKGIEFINNG